MDRLTWTRERPTIAGDFHYRNENGMSWVVTILLNQDQKLIAKGGFWVQSNLVEDMTGEWAGPIPHPEEPRGRDG